VLRVCLCVWQCVIASVSGNLVHTCKCHIECTLSFSGMLGASRAFSCSHARSRTLSASLRLSRAHSRHPLAHSTNTMNMKARLPQHRHTHTHTRLHKHIHAPTPTPTHNVDNIGCPLNEYGVRQAHVCTPRMLLRYIYGRVHGNGWVAACLQCMDVCMQHGRVNAHRRHRVCMHVLCACAHVCSMHMRKTSQKFVLVRTGLCVRTGQDVPGPQVKLQHAHQSNTASACA